MRPARRRVRSSGAGHIQPAREFAGTLLQQGRERGDVPLGQQRLDARPERGRRVVAPRRRDGRQGARVFVGIVARVQHFGQALPALGVAHHVFHCVGRAIEQAQQQAAHAALHRREACRRRGQRHISAAQGHRQPQRVGRGLDVAIQEFVHPRIARHVLDQRAANQRADLAE